MQEFNSLKVLHLFTFVIRVKIKLKTLIIPARAGSKDLRIEGQNLTVRKLGYADQDVICDASVIGLELSNTFDHLLAASTHGGFFVG